MVRHGRSGTSHGFSLLPIFLFVILVGAALFAGFYWLESRFSSFNKFSKYTIAINQDSPIVVSLDLKLKKANVFVFPSVLQVFSAHGYGSLPIGGVFLAGQWDLRGKQVFADTLADLLGVSIDAVFDMPGGNLNLSTSTPFLNKVFFTPPKLIFKTIYQIPKKSDYENNLLDVWKMSSFWFGLRSDKITTINLEKYTGDLVLGNGTQVRTFDKDKFDSTFANILAQPDLVDEDLRVGVVNATSVDGLASRAVRFLTNQGINVVSVDSISTGQAMCEVSFSDEKVRRSQTAKLIQQYFSCSLSYNRDLNNRFDLLLVLGSDFAGRFEK